MQYKIFAQSKNGFSHEEVIDVAETREEARIKVGEFKLAYGNVWKVWFKAQATEIEEVNFLYKKYLM